MAVLKHEAERQVLWDSLMVTRAIWIMMMAALFPYTLVGLALGSGKGSGGLYLIEAIFGCLVLLVPVFAHFQGNRILAAMKPDPENRVPFLERAANRYHTAKVVQLALCKSVGVTGLTLYVLGTSPATFFGFMGYTLLLLILFRPSRKALAAYVTELETNRPDILT